MNSFSEKLSLKAAAGHINHSRKQHFTISKLKQYALESPQTLLNIVTPTRVIYAFLFSVVFWLLKSSIPASHESFQKYYCFGPAMSPFEIDPNTYSNWHRNSPSPVKFNTHVPITVNQDANSTSSSISFFDLNKITSTFDGVINKERVLLLSPLKDAAHYLPKYFDLLLAMTYPHELIDLAFLISDSSDETLAVLTTELERVQAGKKPFNRVNIFTKDFDFKMDNMDVEERHSFAAQAPRRKAMAKARNYLLSAALRPEHAWVMWRDVDIVESPQSIVEDLVRHNVDVIVPNVWFHRYKDGKDIEGRFDYNSWKDTDKTRALLKSLANDPETVLVEGYKEFDTGREYMARMGDWHQDVHEEITLDGVGGVNIMVKADVHRSGINFPAYAFEHQVETEGFAKMAKRAGYKVVGLPNYVVWHIDTDEKPRD